MNEVYAHTELIVEDCCVCGVSFAVPKEFREHRRNTGDSFFCPNGHSLVFKSRLKELESKLFDAEKRGRELQCQLLNEQSARETAERKLHRVSKGVCPCCKRHFTNLERHMATKHPERKVNK